MEFNSYISFCNLYYFYLFSDLSKSLIGYEFGTSRDPEKMKAVLENMTILVPQVHG